jgi:hypothetical protein
MSKACEDRGDNKIKNINDLSSRIIRNHISNLLKVINSKYPVKFPINELQNELELIMTHINYTNDILLQDHPTITTANKIFSKDEELTSKSKPKPKPKQKPKPTVDNVDRCQARIWDSIFDRSTSKEVANVDEEFQVSDYNDINIKKFNKKYILGKQCSRKKLSTNYCIQHNRHRPHGNYLEQPSKDLCLHFMIDGCYVDFSTYEE